MSFYHIQERLDSLLASCQGEPARKVMKRGGADTGYFDKGTSFFSVVSTSR